MAYRSASGATPEPTTPLPWQRVVEVELYEHLGSPETWLARSGDGSALLIEARLLRPENFHGEQEALFADLGRLIGASAPLLTPISIESRPITERFPGSPPQGPQPGVLDRFFPTLFGAAGALANRDTTLVAVCPWPDAAGMTLTGLLDHLPDARLPAPAAVAVVARLARACLMVPETLFTLGRIVVFDSGEVRVAPHLPTVQRQAEPSFTGQEYLDVLGHDHLPPMGHPRPDPHYPVFLLRYVLDELLTGFGPEVALDKRRATFARLSSDPSREEGQTYIHEPLSLDAPGRVARPAPIEALVSEVLARPPLLAELTERLESLARTLDGEASLGQVVTRALRAAASAPPSVPDGQGGRRYRMMPRIGALGDGQRWP